MKTEYRIFSIHRKNQFSIKFNWIHCLFSKWILSIGIRYSSRYFEPAFLLFFYVKKHFLKVFAFISSLGVLTSALIILYLDIIILGKSCPGQRGSNVCQRDDEHTYWSSFARYTFSSRYRKHVRHNLIFCHKLFWQDCIPFISLIIGKPFGFENFSCDCNFYLMFWMINSKVSDLN